VTVPVNRIFSVKAVDGASISMRSIATAAATPINFGRVMSVTIGVLIVFFSLSIFHLLTLRFAMPIFKPFASVHAQLIVARNHEH
jgi:hypothetical protein